MLYNRIVRCFRYGKVKKYEKEICCTCSRRRKLYRNNSYDEFERVTEDGDFPAIEDYCRVVGRYDTEDEAFESLIILMVMSLYMIQ